jgi:diguanylate cyclase (GGDEF)-like protein
VKYRPSIIQYSLVFIAIITLAFATLGITIYHQFSTLEDEIKDKQAAQAASALRQNLALLDQLVVSTGQEIANWQETRQQLDNPRYYAYWRDSRVPQQAFYLDTMEAIELYDDSRNALYESAVKGMPSSLERTSGFSIIPNDNGYSIIHATPISSIEWGDKGYVLLRVNLEQSLRQLFPIQEIDMQSLRFDVSTRHLASLSHLVLVASYATSENKHIHALHTLVNNNLYRAAILIFILSILFMLFGSVLIVNPIRRLAHHIADLQNFHQHPENIKACDFSLKELQLVCNSLDDYHIKLSEMNADLDEKNQELWLQAHHDPLTGVFNRRAFELDWQHIETAVQGRRINIAFMLIDCDRFKTLNDTYGHDTGDKVLIEISSNIQQCLRASDKLYRLGGDEFATLFIDATQEESALVAHRCLERVANINISALGLSEPLQISVGLACTLASNLEKLHELHHQADTAMYHAKRPGKDKIAIYDDSMLNDSLVLLNNRITSAVHNAVTIGDTLELHFQAIVDCKTNQTSYYELLIRIRDKEELMLPGKILPVVHDRRIEVEFDTAVITKLSLQLSVQELPPHCGIAMNISGLSILSTSIINILLNLIKERPQYNFYIEITETALITRLQQASENLDRLRRAGFIIMLDDFGSGYSSIRYLARMPIDGIKFDHSLIQSLSNNDKDAMIIESLAKMIIEAGYQLVAEGIESQSLLDKVKEIGFTHAQGFYIHKPTSSNNLS